MYLSEVFSCCWLVLLRNREGRRGVHSPSNLDRPNGVEPMALCEKGNECLLVHGVD